MKNLFAFCLCFVVINSFAKEVIRCGSNNYNYTVEMTNPETDSLPSVFPANHADIVGTRLKNEACLRFMQFNLPATRQELEISSTRLKNAIIEKAGITIDHNLPFDYHETGTLKKDGFTIKNIYFQTLPGVYATANLYIPDGKGPFPAVLNSNGHWPGARMCEPVQLTAQALALNGYVVLCMDAFGTGERSTVSGFEEYHGANHGLSLLNIGKSLMGIQVSENMRCIDLLCSLPFVDADNIGATGASGGGNQTMWIAAMDSRVKAAVPVVSVGSFESYIMESNCVCELFIDGLTLTEESGILAMTAPRALLMLNHNKESNPTFFPSEMLRTFSNAKPVYEMLGAGENLGYRLFDLPHDYLQDDRDAMLKWFGIHLKKDKVSTAKEVVLNILPFEELRVFTPGNRYPKVMSIGEYCRRVGEEQRKVYLSSPTIDKDKKKEELIRMLRINKFAGIKEIHQYSDMDGWNRFAIESTDGKLIPLLHVAPQKKEAGYTILCDPQSKKGISLAVIDELKKKGSGIVIIDLYGSGENASAKAFANDHVYLPEFHTLSRAELWLGRTLMGEWVDDLNLTIEFLENKFKAGNVNIDAHKEAGLAGLYFSVLKPGKVTTLSLHEAPASYLFDTREGIDFFSMGIHIPKFLLWGDVSLACALSDAEIQFIKPVTMSGKQIAGDKMKSLNSEYETMGKKCGRTFKEITFKSWGENDQK